MNAVVQEVLDWSEVWALLIPLVALSLRSKQPAVLAPVIVYLLLSLLLNLFGDVIADFKIKWHFPSWLQSNNPIYNLLSLVRFGCFAYFFLVLPQSAFKAIKKSIAVLFVLFVIVNFSFFENFLLPDHLSGNLLSLEAYLLLIYCLLYYLAVLNDEEDVVSKGPTFWIVTGLSVYVVTNFFVFLFYVPMVTQNPLLANDMWNVHNIVNIILCLLITKALYAPAGN